APNVPAELERLLEDAAGGVGIELARRIARSRVVLRDRDAVAVDHAAADLDHVPGHADDALDEIEPVPRALHDDDVAGTRKAPAHERPLEPGEREPVLAACDEEPLGLEDGR